jgi:von Willebrand factor type A domain
LRTTRPWISFFGAAVLLACTAGTNTPSTGRGGNGGGGNTTGAAGNSGPGIGGFGGSTVSGAAGVISIGGSGGGNQMCGLQKFDVERKPAEILLLLDRSKSMIEDTTSDGVTLKWNAVLPALKQVIMDTDSAVSWGLKTFPEGLGAECVTGSVTNNVVVPIAPMNAAAVVGALNDTTNPATQPQGNGTPTGDAITAAFNYLKTLTTTNPKYILLATDGAPSCAGTTKDSSTARTYAYTHVMDAASASPPIYTFVVGVATNSSSETSTLNMLADAGGRPRPGLLTHFYLGNTTSELTAALAQITGQAATCTFPLNPPPPVLNEPTKLGMYFPPTGNPKTCAATTDCPGGQSCVNSLCMLKVPYDGAMGNGWAYTDANDTAVQAYGSWCDMIKASGANTVQVIYGCPTIDVP